jgi:hypothetical protein
MINGTRNDAVQAFLIRTFSLGSGADKDNDADDSYNDDGGEYL